MNDKSMLKYLSAMMLAGSAGVCAESLEFTGELNVQTPKVTLKPSKSPIYEGVEEVSFKVEFDSAVCNPSYISPVQTGRCYVTFPKTPSGFTYDPAKSEFKGVAPDGSPISVDYFIEYINGSAKSPVKIAEGNYKFDVSPVKLPVVSSISSNLDSHGFVESDDLTIYKKSLSGEIIITTDARPFPQVVTAGAYGSCTIPAGALSCTISNQNQGSIFSAVSGKVSFPIAVNSSNSYFENNISTVSVSWDFSAPEISSVAYSSTPDQLAKLDFLNNQMLVPYQNIGVVAKSTRLLPGEKQQVTVKTATLTSKAVDRTTTLTYKDSRLADISDQISRAGIFYKDGFKKQIADGDYAYFTSDASDLKDGSYDVAVTVVDQDGNESTSSSFPLVVDKVYPVIGIYDDKLKPMKDGQSIFFLDGIHVVGFNGKNKDVKVTASVGEWPVNLQATDVDGVFEIKNFGDAYLKPGSQYILHIEAVDGVGRKSVKDVKFNYADANVKITHSPAQPARFVEPVNISVIPTGTSCNIYYSEDDAIKMAALSSGVACHIEWTLPDDSMVKTTSALGRIGLSGYVRGPKVQIPYKLFAYNSSGNRVLLNSSTYEITSADIVVPEIVVNSKRKQNEYDMMVDINGGMAGTANLTTSPGDVIIDINVDGGASNKESVNLRPMGIKRRGKTTRMIKVPQGSLWTTYPYSAEVTYKYAPDVKNRVSGTIYLVPTKQTRVMMEPMEKIQGSTSVGTVKVMIGVPQTGGSLAYEPSLHGEWRVRLVEEKTVKTPKGMIKQMFDLADPIMTDNAGLVTFTLPLDKFEGRSLSYKAVADVVSPFENFKLQIQSKKKNTLVLKGESIGAALNEQVIVDRVPMNADIVLKPKSNLDADALGAIQWQLKPEGEDWRPIEDAKSKKTYRFTSEVAGRWEIRALMTNAITGVESYSESATLVAYDKPEIKIVQKNPVLKGQPVPVSITATGIESADDLLEVEWSTDSQTWMPGPIDTSIEQDGKSRYIFARAKYKSTYDEADEASWAEAKLSPQIFVPSSLTAKVDLPEMVESGVPVKLKGTFKDEYSLVPGLVYHQEWETPEGIQSGGEIEWIPSSSSKKPTVKYRVWVEGYKDETIREVAQTVKVWDYVFPRLTTGERQHYRLAPTKIEMRNTTILPTYPGVVYTTTIEPSAGVKEVSFDGTRFIGEITEPGVYVVKLTMSDNRGNAETSEHMFAVDEAIPMEVSIKPTYSNKFMRAPLNVTMSSTFKLDHPSDSLVQYGWTLDGQEVKDTLRRQLFTGLTAGDHTIVFTALSEYGQRAHVEHNFTVVPNKPAECKLEPTSTASSWRVNMSCIDTDGRVVAYRWKINGEVIGNTSYAISLTKSLNPGGMEIEAVAIDDSGDETTATTTLTGE